MVRASISAITGLGALIVACLVTVLLPKQPLQAPPAAAFASLAAIRFASEERAAEPAAMDARRAPQVAEHAHLRQAFPATQRRSGSPQGEPPERQGVSVGP